MKNENRKDWNGNASKGESNRCEANRRSKNNLLEAEEDVVGGLWKGFC